MELRSAQNRTVRKRSLGKIWRQKWRAQMKCNTQDQRLCDRSANSTGSVGSATGFVVGTSALLVNGAQLFGSASTVVTASSFSTADGAVAKAQTVVVGVRTSGDFAVAEAASREMDVSESTEP